VNVDVRMIRQHQHPSGAYPASPSFSRYPYCWFRDGSFIAYAMDRVGEHKSAAAFHAWAAKTIERHANHIVTLLDRSRGGGFAEANEFLPARFTVDGEWREDGWPNFQLDGYGHWLWSLSEHLEHTRRSSIPQEWRASVDLVVRYLAAFWLEPCYDAWEEYRSQLHTSTLASIYGGLNSIARFGLQNEELARTIAEIHNVIMTECVMDGRFVKHVANLAVDASLLWVSTPFGVVPPKHPMMVRTVKEIERTLLSDGGVKRYAADTFYGGGTWILLTAWLGWHHARSGNTEGAKACAEWIERHRDADGALPEQVPPPTCNRRFLDFWSSRWGSSAKPLLWSHAMNLVLVEELDARVRAALPITARIPAG
jgi:GH15 family glucan-1,4-alpha-glucosidase